MGIEAGLGSVIGGALGLGGSLFGASQANKAANTQANAAQSAQDLQYKMFTEQNALQEPFRQAGMTGQNQLMALLGLGPNTGQQGYGMYAAPPTQADLQMDPGYGFRFNEGMKAMNATAAARGGLQSGAALKAGQRYGQDMGSQEYGNAFNRYLQTKASMLNPLQSLSGAGQTASNAMAGYAGQYGANAGELGMQGANARASGYIGQANALTGGIGNYLQQQNQQNWLARMYSPASGGSAGQNYSWGMPASNPAYAGMIEPYPGQ